MPPTPVLLVDGHHLLYRCYFGFPARITSRDRTRDLTGVFGFLALLRKAHMAHAADHQIVVVFDGEHGSAARTQADPAYKANRAEADHSPIQSLPDTKNGLDLVGVPWIEIDTAEGDDVIATLTAVASEADRPVLVMSGDKDLLQLLDRPRTRVLNTAAKSDRQITTPADVLDRGGVLPRQWPDFRALTGDPADNITGVRGVGPATAARLLSGGIGLEEVFSSDRLSGAIGQRVLNCRQDLLRWRELIRLDHKVPLTPPTGTEPTPELPPAARVLDGLRLW
ncbi:DNA polymerase-1 [Nocardiopsis sp. Huas11]|uniref:5'-3' exonuclease n=1 Tax=Nocardiopsis sp. Huas11 TaxID=2183912 RepID=UPI000F113D3F|nr:5'-3' exonuclease H3TH domain-containing protein [Nocardiopsis sp. Huas11]RKS07034.1 DNA polymerase-1 [Nocardiopsis sp. Huas11]